jgi:superoxide dismutase, Cu-Zn family
MNKFLKFASLSAALAVVSVAAGCAGGGHADRSAEAQLKPTQGNTAAGTVSFSQEGGAVRVRASVSGLTPGAHGFHIHDKGDCSAPDATSAGGHFNPGGKPHGAPDHAEHHAGDLPQLVADAAGDARLDALLPGLAIGEGVDVVGRGVIVHAAADDFKTQPTGNSGARIACGVIAAR